MGRFQSPCVHDGPHEMDKGLPFIASGISQLRRTDKVKLRRLCRRCQPGKTTVVEFQKA